MSESIKIEVEAVDLASSVLSGIGGAGVAMGAAIVGALIGATAAMADFVNTASEAQDVQVMFDQIVSNSPLAGYTEEMHGLADSLSLVTKFDDEAILGAEGVLAKYGTIGKEAFPQATKATLDLAESMKTTADAAAGTLGRALKDLASGSANILVRSGALKDGQAELITQMAKAGDTAGAQALLFKYLEGNIGGLAEKMGGTFSGQMKIFQNTIDNIKESFGEKLLPILTPLIGKIADLALKYAPLLGSVLDKYVVPIIGFFVDKTSELIDVLSNTQRPLQIMTNLFRSLTGYNPAIIFARMKPGMNSFASFWTQVSPVIKKTADDLFKSLGDTFKDLASKVIPWMIEKFNQIGKWFSDNGPLISRFADVIGKGIALGFQLASTVIQMLMPVLDLVGNSFANLAKAVMQIGTGDFKGAMNTFLQGTFDTFNGIGNIISTWGNLIGAYFGVTWAQSMAGWQNFFNGIGALISDMLNNFKLVFVGIPTLIGLALANVAKAVGAWFAAQLVSWSNGWKAFQAAVSFVFESIRLAIDAKFHEIVNGISLFISDIVTAFNQSAQQFADIGTTIVNGIQLGISGAWASLTTIVTGLVGDLIEAIKKMFGLGGTGGASVLGGITDALKGAASGAPTTATTASASASNASAQRASGSSSGQNIGKVVNNFIGPITLKLQSDSDFLKAR